MKKAYKYHPTLHPATAEAVVEVWSKSTKASLESRIEILKQWKDQEISLLCESNEVSLAISRRLRNGSPNQS